MELFAVELFVVELFPERFTPGVSLVENAAVEPMCWFWLPPHDLVEKPSPKLTPAKPGLSPVEPSVESSVEPSVEGPSVEGPSVEGPSGSVGSSAQSAPLVSDEPWPNNAL